MTQAIVAPAAPSAGIDHMHVVEQLAHVRHQRRAVFGRQAADHGGVEDRGFFVRERETLGYQSLQRTR